MDERRSGSVIPEAWALLVERTDGGIEVMRGGLTLPGAQGAADAIIAARPEVRQITAYPIEGSHAEGKASWVRTQDRAWTSTRSQV